MAVTYLIEDVREEVTELDKNDETRLMFYDLKNLEA